MSSPLESLAARKALLLSRSSLQRMQLALGAAELRSALRPRALFSGLFTSPSAIVSGLGLIAPLIGLRRFAKWFRFGGMGMAIAKKLGGRFFTRR